MSSASSQLMRSHSSMPRKCPFTFSPPPGCQFLRFMGYFKRSAPNTSCWCERPRGQLRFWKCPSSSSAYTSSVFWRTTTPSYTSALFTHRPPQWCQQAAGTHVPFASASRRVASTLQT